MNDFKKAGKMSRGGKRRLGGRDFGGEMHTATCNKCRAACEVPFRPNGKKPVYCRDCFVRDDASPAGSPFQMRGFGAPRPFSQPAPSIDAVRLAAMQKEISIMHEKLDALIASIGHSRQG